MLAFVLFSYGFAKVFPIQFQTPAFFSLMKPHEKRAQVALLAWSRPDAIHLVLTGTFEGASTAIHLQRIDQDLPLLTHYFHWILDDR